MSNQPQMANSRPSVSSRNSVSFKCNYPNCPKVCQSKIGFEIHQRVHTGEKPFHCEICTKSFRAQHHLTHHNQDHHWPKNFPCETCGLLFGRKYRLRLHLQSHSSERFCCDLCGKSYHHKSNLITHQKRHHSATKRKASSSRYLVTKRKASRSRFLAGSNEEDEYRMRIAQPTGSDVLASVANKLRPRTKTPNYRAYEEVEFEGNESESSGSDSQESDYEPSELDSEATEIDNAQNGNQEKKLRCETCGKDFSFIWHLEQHRQVHSNKRFACDLCENRSFQHERNLWRHQVTEHKQSWRRYQVHHRSATQPETAGPCNLPRDNEEHGIEIEQPNSSDGSVNATSDPRDRTPNCTVNRENAECDEESGSRVLESLKSGAQLQNGEGASSDPAARGDDVPYGEEQNGRSDQDVSAVASRDRADILMIVLSSDEEDDQDGQEDLFFENLYKQMNQVADDESSEPDEERVEEALDEELNGNLFFEEEYRRMSGVNQRIAFEKQ